MREVGRIDRRDSSYYFISNALILSATSKSQNFFVIEFVENYILKGKKQLNITITPG